jgi:hypothetical protein
VQPAGAQGQSQLAADLRLDAARNVAVILTNTTSQVVRDVVVAIRYPDPQGGMRQVTGTYRGPLVPGQQVQLSTGLGPLRDARAMQSMRVQVLDMRVVP